MASVLAAGDPINFATFTAGTVMTANPGIPFIWSEHMASCEPTYKATALRDWLFAQSS